MSLTKLFFFSLVCLCFFAGCGAAKTEAGHKASGFGTQDGQQIIAAMNKSAEDWNRADLDAFMSIYDTSATFMTPRGPIGVAAMRENYDKGFFVNGKPKQNLRFEEMTVKPLGANYALLLGKFVLYGNNLKDVSGRYSVVFIRTATGWKMFHDHSG
jgi:ketosteroid isomerase-like protein